MRTADRSLERSSKGRKALNKHDWHVLQRLIVILLENPLQSPIDQLLLTACMWVASDDHWISCPNEFKTRLKTLSNGVPRSNYWVSGLETCERHWMNFTTAFESLPFSLYNRSFSYARNMYSSNWSSWYFPSNGIRLASLFSSFISHNALFSSVM